MLIELVPLALTGNDKPIDPTPIPILRKRKNSPRLSCNIFTKAVYPSREDYEERGIEISENEEYFDEFRGARGE